MVGGEDLDERDDLIGALFAAAKGMHPAEQRKFLDENTSHYDGSVRADVEALLAAFKEAPSPEITHRWFDEDAVARALDATDEEATEHYEGNLRPGDNVGPYKLLELIGEGGMGSVYVAEQEVPVRRRVALKLIKAGMDSSQLSARFEAERQALALMDHPNVARVYDAGATKSGRPYFVMELVKGVPITTYADRHRLTTRQRCELFVPVCMAVAHAHQKGVIHRDLKPSNVLVAEYDNLPVPKVIDSVLPRPPDKH